MARNRRWPVTAVTSLANVDDEADANGVLRILLIGALRAVRP
jgi:hypothetical protein